MTREEKEVRRELTQAQRDFVALMNNPETRAQQKALDETHRAAAAVARKEAEAKRAIREANDAARQKLEDEAIERIEGVMRSVGIKLRIGGCGCCGSPYLDAEFPDGFKIQMEGASVNTFEEDAVSN